MEVLAIIATEDNTSYYINGSATPNTLAKRRLHASSNYVNLNSSVDAYNMYIKSDKNIRLSDACWCKCWNRKILMRLEE